MVDEKLNLRYNYQPVFFFDFEIRCSSLKILFVKMLVNLNTIKS